jgi:hypothetical protein
MSDLTHLMTFSSETPEPVSPPEDPKPETDDPDPEPSVPDGE